MLRDDGIEHLTRAEFIFQAFAVRQRSRQILHDLRIHPMGRIHRLGQARVLIGIQATQPGSGQY